MATPNFVHIEKTIDDDGFIAVDFVTDGIEVNGQALNASIQVALNGTDPTTPLRGITMLSDGEPLEFSDIYKAWMFTLRATDGQGFAVSHMDAAASSAEQILVPFIGDDAVVVSNHVFGIWRGGPTRLNLYIPLNPATTPTQGSTSDPTTSSSTFAVLAEMTVDHTPANTYADVLFTGTFDLAPTNPGDTVIGEILLTVDGSPVSGTTKTLLFKSGGGVGDSAGRFVGCYSIDKRITGLMPGTEVTIAVEWRATSGEIKATGTERTLRIW